MAIGTHKIIPFFSHGYHGGILGYDSHHTAPCTSSALPKQSDDDVPPADGRPAEDKTKTRPRETGQDVQGGEPQQSPSNSQPDSHSRQDLAARMAKMEEMGQSNDRMMARLSEKLDQSLLHQEEEMRNRIRDQAESRHAIHSDGEEQERSTEQNKTKTAGRQKRERMDNPNATPSGISQISGRSLSTPRHVHFSEDT
jgi:hypothetical protein